MAVSAEEKIRQLLESEKHKRKEIDERKKELEKKKKEVEELERAGKKEIADSQKEIEEQLEELFTEEKESYAKEEKKKRSQENESLEEKVGPAKKEGEGEFKGYGDAIESVMRGNHDFYSLTNYNVMNHLESIAEEARNRPLTKEEKEFVKTVQYHAKQIVGDDFYRNDPGQEYLRKELIQIGFINKMTTKKTEYTGHHV